MKSTPDRPRTGEADPHPEIRQQLIALIRRGKTKSVFTTERPTDVRFRAIIHPESGLELTEAGMWREIERFLELGVPLKAIVLDQPPGEEAWVFRARLAPGSTLIYVKLQIRGSIVLLRSFHPCEHADD